MSLGHEQFEWVNELKRTREKLEKEAGDARSLTEDLVTFDQKLEWLLLRLAEVSIKLHEISEQEKKEAEMFRAVNERLASIERLVKK